MTTDNTIAFEKIVVRRGAAFDPPGFEVDELSPGINIIYGPNASGKTTLAQAIQTLLWPEKSSIERAELIGLLRQGEVQWRIDFEGDRVSRQRDGADVFDGPGVPSTSARDRYYLCLHDLLQTEGNSFAQIIVRESAGGYDVDAAGESLDYSTATPRRGQAARDVEEAKTSWKNAGDKQRALFDRERDLRRLEKEREESDRAARRLRVVELAIEFQKAYEEARSARLRFDQFPSAMDAVQGDELTVIDGHQQRLNKSAEEVTEHREIIESCENSLAESPIPDGGIDSDILPTLDGYADRIEELERDERSFQQKLADRTKVRDRERRYFASEWNVGDDLSDMNIDTIRSLEALARESEGLAAEQRAFQILQSLLVEDESVQKSEQLDDGIRLLRRWLRTPQKGDSATSDNETSTGPARIVALICAIAIAFVAIALALLIHPAWAALLSAAAAMGWIFWSLRKTQPVEGDRRRVYRRDYERLDLKSPGKWSEDKVESRLEELIEQHSQASVEAEKRARWKSTAVDREELESRQSRVQQRRQKLAREIGINIEDNQAASTAWLVSKIHRWQEACSEVEGLRESIAKVERQQSEQLGRVADTLREFGFEAPRDAAQARARVEALKDGVRRYESDSQRMKVAEGAVATAERHRNEADSQILAIFERLGLNRDDHHKLAELCRQKEDYNEARQALDSAEREAQRRERELREHSAFEPELLDKGFDELNTELKLQREQAERRDELTEKIESIRADMRAAKQSFEVEEKSAEYESRREILKRERRNSYRRAMGAVLVEHVKDKTRDSNRPQVFHRAREFFAHITRGAYRLELNEGKNGPEFRARDVSRERGLAIDQLSSGTRLQLLLAIRVAFVEQQEKGAKIPLVFDETLANSDDERARAIVEAVEEIAVDGRQIFYFTAQHDEVRKWQVFLDSSDVERRFFDLATFEPGVPTGDIYGDEALPPRVADLPNPASVNHEEYGKAIGVGYGLSPWKPVGSIHLWYLIDDLDSLHRLLKTGVARWGQLRTLSRHGGLASVGISRDEYAVIEARAHILETLADARAVGRGQEVTPQALAESDAVSDTYMERAEQLCEDVGGDAEELVAGLKDGKLKRFRSENIETLQLYLENKGYLDTEEKLSNGEIWTRILAAAAPAIAKGLIDEQDIRRLLNYAGGTQSG